ncbi:DUF305 domain-containing protein [Nocardioides sp. SOB77]|uniref:DUF305 domain-containing protein n=1 Tax=Nocardioides oceani TaxID=3058369 RepID=A0ABT8FMG5_9ACTN|nr:DUF305 domain-containing protein [Nocardioides oceani]MDN4175868.1 DUF305 domain-containing protein [Nocardioides oceani]
MKKKHERRMYLKFGAMIATSAAVMFVLMYSSVYNIEHVHYSQERLYMALTSTGAMALVMLAFMATMMYKNRTLNIVVVVAALVVGLGAFYASRTQLFIDDEKYMKAMIPHHSIAILTSERADIDDVRVRRLANQIIEAQRREIKEMEWLLQDIDENGLATTEEEADARPVPDFKATATTPLGTDRHWVTVALSSTLGVPQLPLRVVAAPNH